MGTRSFSSLLAFAFLSAVPLVPSPSLAQEIPLERCDKLPVIEVSVGGQPMLFLVDTAATSILNLGSFAEGRAQSIKVTSWSGTLATSAREVSLGAVEVGATKMLGLRLPAIDLSAVGKACGRKIDGIFGVDLLGRLGATIDMKRQMVHVATASEAQGDALAEEMRKEMHRCLEAFNQSDERAFAECLDPKVVLFSGDVELYGREKAMGHFRDRYFHQEPAARLEIRERAFHPIGEAVWYEYEFTIDSARGVLRGKGMAMCRKTEGRWRIASMHHSVLEMEARPTGK